MDKNINTLNDMVREGFDSVYEVFGRINEVARDKTISAAVKNEFYRELLEQVIENVEGGMATATLRDDYSGRGMYGKRCFGISTDSPATVLGYAAAHGLIEGANMDSMGMHTIVYWPWLKNEE